MKRTLTITLVLVAMSAATVVAQPGGRHRGQGLGICPHDGFGKGAGRGMQDGTPGVWMLLRNADAINLTDQQQDQLKQMAETFGLEKIDLQANVKKARIRLQTLLRDEDAPESSVMAAIDDLTRARAEMHKMNYRHHRQVRGVLSDQQLDKIRQLRQERQQNRWQDQPRPGRRLNPRGSGFGCWFDENVTDDG